MSMLFLLWSAGWFFVSLQIAHTNQIVGALTQRQMWVAGILLFFIWPMVLRGES